MTKFIHLFLLLILPEIGPCQISGIINSYVKVIAIDNSCNKVTIDPSIGLTTSNFTAGTKVLIIQMKGATIDATNSSSFGNISSFNDAGNYEMAEIFTVIDNGSFKEIYFKNTLLKSYTPSGYVQLISVPQYSDVTVTGTLTAKTWDGNTGGVLVLEASGTATLNASIDVSGLGFRGGSANPGSGSPCNPTTAYYGDKTSDVIAMKGEGIADYISTKESGRGKLANGGGGGTSNNYGGAGGSNYGAGGRGGNQSSGCNSFLFPNTYFAIPGAIVSYSNSSNKIFLGGGGGGGHQNNWVNPGPPTWTGGTPGGPGGGIAIIKAGTLIGNGNSIISKGTLDPVVYRAWGDGAGGGGAGGTILLSITNYSSSISVDVSGGKGDDVYDQTSRNLGPGGGGGGGLIWVSDASLNSVVSPVFSGGISGTMTATCLCANGAVAGSAGGTLTGLSIPQSTSPFSPCGSLPVSLVSFKALSFKDRIKLEWITESEKDNGEFIIEKTQDLSSYEFVSTVKATNHTQSIKTYASYDFSPSTGKIYYRLSQRDINGKVSIVGLAVAALTEDKLIMDLYPIPFSDDLTLVVNPSSSEVEIRIINSIGEIVYDKLYTNDNPFKLLLDQLSPGIYELIVKTDLGIETKSIVKEK